MNKEAQLKRFHDTLTKEANSILAAQANIDSFDVLEAANHIVNSKGKLIIVGLGKSGYIGTKLAASFSSMGMPSYFLHATELFHGDFGSIQDADILMLLSHSGETMEVIQAGEVIKSRGNIILSITKSKHSSLAQLSTISLTYGTFVEADHLNMAPTASSTVMLAVGDALMVLVSSLKQYQKEDFLKNHPGGSLGKAGK